MVILCRLKNLVTSTKVNWHLFKGKKRPYPRLGRVFGCAKLFVIKCRFGWYWAVYTPNMDLVTKGITKGLAYGKYLSYLKGKQKELY